MPPTTEMLRYHGLLIRVPDLSVALEFYCNTLGYAFTRSSATLVRLSDPVPFYLEAVSARSGPAKDQARAGAAFFVRDIQAAIERLDALGVPLLVGRGQEASGGFVTCFLDPLGNVHTIVQPVPEPLGFREPQIYYTGLKLPMGSIPTARQIYRDMLGFAIATERYYPPSLPLKHGDGSFAFMIQDKQPWESDVRVRAPLYPSDSGSVLVFATNDVSEFHAYVSGRSAAVRTSQVEEFALGLRMGFIDNSGVPSEIWQFAVDPADERPDCARR
jgi:catechol 2,3-dioxygenase-like lactoylglutathione lyase family enzyme